MSMRALCDYCGRLRDCALCRLHPCFDCGVLGGLGWQCKAHPLEPTRNAARG